MCSIEISTSTLGVQVKVLKYVLVIALWFAHWDIGLMVLFYLFVCCVVVFSLVGLHSYYTR